MVRVRRSSSLLLACAALAGAGCGGGGEGGGGDRYLREVDAFCVDTERGRGDLPQPRAFGDLLPLLRRVAELSEREPKRFERLDPPPALRGYHRRVIERYEESRELFETAAEGIERGADPMAVYRRLVPVADRLVEESNREARKLGLDDCVVEPPPR